MKPILPLKWKLPKRAWNVYPRGSLEFFIFPDESLNTPQMPSGEDEDEAMTPPPSPPLTRKRRREQDSEAGKTL